MKKTVLGLSLLGGILTTGALILESRSEHPANLVPVSNSTMTSSNQSYSGEADELQNVTEFPAKDRTRTTQEKRPRAATKVSTSSRHQSASASKRKAAKAKAKRVRNKKTHSKLSRLSSIYEEKVDSPSNAKAPKKRRVLYGVPLEEWVLSRRDQVALSLPENQAGGLRVLLWCMNPQKNMKSLAYKECRQALKVKSSVEGIARLQ